MEPQELEHWIETHGYTREELAAALSVHIRTLYRWLAGEVQIPGSIPLALKGLETN